MAVPQTIMEDMVANERRTLVVGLGKTGLSVARYLLHRGIPVAIVDSRAEPPGLKQLRADLPADVALFLGGFEDAVFDRAEQIIVSPGVALTTPQLQAARERGIAITGDIELFAQVATAPVVAITGSNGKSTVTTLLNAMAQRAGVTVRTGGNIGTPALDLLGDTEPDLYVLELSSFQLETTQSLQPAAAVVLNISADHMDRYPDMEAYAAAKQAIYSHAALQIVNADDPAAARLADPDRPQVRYTQQTPAAGEYGICAREGITWLACGDEMIMPVSEIGMAGRHNTVNALAALALGAAVGLPRDAMVETLREFHGLPHRMQRVSEHNGVTWYNDSKGTNVGATLAAIDGVDTRVVLIAGGDAKGADLSPLADALQRKGRGAVLIGKAAAELQSLLAGVLPVELADAMTQAVELAAGMAQPGDAVLLSPACASTDMYRDFRERGDVFVAAVRELGS
ncbi:MAG: UDP-N-acetylmuramoyl-L-alanine--D-glutamate ligase [Gammaproteobacteria bacterium]|nr:UDP-N-acetylmuramoyl-L-alanine--D-glutamate ligase [Gammaproteobacteria bacterium]